MKLPPEEQAKADERYMLMAIAEAERAIAEGEIPVGAVVVAAGRVVARAHNLCATSPPTPRCRPSRQQPTRWAASTSPAAPFTSLWSRVSCVQAPSRGRSSPAWSMAAATRSAATKPSRPVPSTPGQA